MSRTDLDDLHGPAWADGTPRTEAEAREMLASAEPRAAQSERLWSRDARSRGSVLVMLPAPRDPRYSPFASLGISAWRPRATRTLDGRRVLSGGWLDAPVPPLCTRVPRCEATGARVVVVDTADLEARASLKDRYGPALCPLLWARYMQNRSNGAWVIGTLLRVQTGASGGRYYAETFGEIESTTPRPAHAGPYGEPRGWCRGLNGDVAEAR